MTFTADQGDTVSGVCIKSGENMFGGTKHSGVLTENTTYENECYSVAGVGTGTVTVTRIGSGPNCQGISHIDAVVTEGPEVDLGSITVVKQGLSAGDTANFTVTGGAAFSLGAGGSHTVPDLAAGNYTITEAAMQGYTLTGASCVLNGGGAFASSLSGNALSVALDGQDITCTFVNGATQGEGPTGSIRIVKEGLLAGATATFTQNIDASGNFSLTSADNSELFTEVAAGTYTVVEQPLEGYELVSAGCAIDTGPSIASAAASTSLSITLAEGQNLVCTFVNAPAQAVDYTVTVHKYLDGQPATTGSFDFTANWDEPDAAAASGNFTLSGPYSVTTSPLGAGSTYSVVENGIDGTCGEGDTYRLAGFGIGATAEAAASATVSPTGAIADLQGNMHIIVWNETCANEETGSITIVKQGLLGDDVAQFTHDVKGGGSFTLDASDNSEFIGDLDAGVYTFTEAELEGYELVSAGCALAVGRSAATDEATGTELEVTLAAGQDLICTFVNAPTQEIDYTVTIHKYVDDAVAVDGEFNFTANWDEPDADAGSGDFALNAGNSFMATTSPLGAGSTYSIVENGIDATCDSGDEYRLAGYGIGADLDAALAATPVATASIADLDSNMVIVVRNVTCLSDYTVTIHKYVDGAAATEGEFNFDANWDEPDADAGSGSFTLNAGNNFMATTAPLTQGSTYSVAETGIDGTCDAGDQYRLAGYTMGADEAAAAGGTVGATGSISDLQGNTHIIVWNVTCEYTVTVHKYVDDTLATSGTFNFEANWQEPGEAAGAGSFSLPNNGAYSISTSSLNYGSDYSVVETGINGTCEAGDTHRLVGYTVGATVEEAEANGVSNVMTDAGMVEDLDGNMHVIVWNAECDFGSITIVKIGLQGSDTAEFSQDIDGSGNFTLDASDNQEVFEDLVAGTYTVTELPLEGYTLVSAGCSLAVGRSVTAEVSATTSLDITLAEGQDLICTFVNGAAQEVNYTVTIHKFVDEEAATEGSFEFDATWQEPEEAEGTGSFTLDSSNSFTAVTSPLAAGSSYGIVETNYDATCDEGDAYRFVGFTVGATAEAAAASTDILTEVSIDDLQSNLHVIVWNEGCETGSITITKAWSGGAAVDTTFTTSANLGVSGNTFDLTGAAATRTFTGLDGDTYVITEEDLEGWTLTSIFCGNEVPGTFGIDLAGGELTVNLEDGQDVSCTFTNTATPDTEGEGSITIVKAWSGGTAADTTFSASGNLGAENDEFVLTGAESDITFENLGNGTYVVTEQDLAGWTLTSIVCSNEVPGTFGIDLAGGVLTINLGDDQDVSCTFTNTADTTTTPGTGTVTIVKSWVGGTAGTANFTSSANLGATGNAFSLSGTTTQMTFDELGAGTYTVTEGALAGWTLTGIDCGNAVPGSFSINLGAGNLSINLGEDQDITCTFTNTANTTTPGAGSITLVKSWGTATPAATTFGLSDGFNDADDTIVLDGANSNELFDNLANGTYTITETVGAGWTLSGATCTGATTSTSSLAGTALTITLAGNEDLVCTFTNAQAPTTGTGTVTIIKVWQNGGAVDTSFTTSANLGDADNAFMLNGGTSQIAFANLGAGTYTVTEVAQTGWTLSAVNCSNAVPGSFSVNLGAGSLSINLTGNETVTCTFTNTANSAVNPSFPPPVNQPPVDNVSPPQTNNPGTNNPGTNNPGTSNPTIPNNPVIPNQPNNNVPSVNNPGPSAVSNSPAPVSSVGGVVSSNQPLPPSTGNGASATESTPLILFAGLAALAGLVAAAGYGVSRKR